MKEREIAEHLIAMLRSNYDMETLVAPQRDICWREGRIDVMVVNGALSGFEIKSARDSLARLPRQAELYSRVLDFGTLVCPAPRVEVAGRLVPDWWAIWEVDIGEAGVAIRPLREGAANPDVRSHDLVRLLLHDELHAELRRRRVPGVSRLCQAEMAVLLSEDTTLDELKEIVRRRLSQRPSWRAAARRS